MIVLTSKESSGAVVVVVPTKSEVEVTIGLGRAIIDNMPCSTEEYYLDQQFYLRYYYYYY